MKMSRTGDPCRQKNMLAYDSSPRQLHLIACQAYSRLLRWPDPPRILEKDSQIYLDRQPFFTICKKGPVSKVIGGEVAIP